MEHVAQTREKDLVLNLDQHFGLWKVNAYERWPTLSTALRLLLQYKSYKPLIIETGCIRQLEDYRAGYSTLLWHSFLSKIYAGGSLISVDIDDKSIGVASKVLHDQKQMSSVNYSFAKEHSVKWLSTAVDRGVLHPDLIYLDSQDCDLVDESITHQAQLHQAEEAFYAIHLEPLIILLDDNDHPFGGKCRLARERLFNSGKYNLLVEGMQSLWIKAL